MFVVVAIRDVCFGSLGMTLSHHARPPFMPPIQQFLCECEDLDESFTNLVTLSRRGPDDGGRATSGWQRVLRVAQDRAR